MAEREDHAGLSRVQVWLGDSVVDALEAAMLLYTYRHRADLVRQYVLEGLRRDGHWPPKGQGEATPPADRKARR